MRVEEPTCERITWGYREPIDAAEDVMGAARQEGPSRRDAWSIKRGADRRVAAAGHQPVQPGHRPVWCGNAYIANGWDVAHAADAEPFRSRVMLAAA